MCHWSLPKQINISKIKFYSVDRNLTNICRINSLDSPYFVLEYNCNHKELHYIQLSENIISQVVSEKRFKLLSFLRSNPNLLNMIENSSFFPSPSVSTTDNSQMRERKISIQNMGNMCHWIASINFISCLNSIVPLFLSENTQYSQILYEYIKYGSDDKRSQIEEIGRQISSQGQQDPTEYLLSQLEYLLPKNQWWGFKGILEYQKSDSISYGRTEFEKQYKLDFVIKGDSIKEIVENNFETIEELERSKYDPSDMIKKYKRYTITYDENRPNCIIFSLKRWSNDGSMITKDIYEDEYFSHNNSKYSLYSIIYKHGSVSENGHYTCLVKRENKFFHINDSQETEYSDYNSWLNSKNKNIFSYIFLYKIE